MYTATCLRRTANWSVLDKEHKFDKPTFNPKKFIQDLPIASPKLLSLLLKIKALDENDYKTEGKVYKHVIFSDVKAGGYGAKVISSALIAAGFNLVFDSKHNMKSETDLYSNSYKNFAILCSTAIYGDKISTELKKDILTMYNKRPENVHGQLMRIIVLDAGFKEGIDLFDVKYLHVFEPQVTDSDLKQVIGRGTRKCGQKGLEFNPQSGWTLNVYIYDTTIPKHLVGKYNSESLYDMFLENSKMDMRKLNFSKQLESLTVKGAVDNPLNKNIHEFRLGASDLLSGGGKKSKKPKHFTKTVSLPKSIEQEVSEHQDINSNLNVSVDTTNTNTQQVFSCVESCTIIPLPLFIAVALVLNASLPDKKNYPRNYFCRLLRTDNAFCKEVEKAYKDQPTYVAKHSRTLLSAIDEGKHLKLGDNLRIHFLRFVYKLVSDKVKDKIITIPNVQRSLISELEEYGVFNASTRKTNTLSTLTSLSRKAVDAASSLIPKSLPTLTSAPTRPSLESAPISEIETKTANVQKRAPMPIDSNPLVKDMEKKKQTASSPLRKVEDTVGKESKNLAVRNEAETFKYLLDNVPMIDKKMSFSEMQEYIVNNYSAFSWPQIKVENQCVSKGGNGIGTDKDVEQAVSALNKGVNNMIIASFTPTQDFLRHYFTPSNPYKGMLLWHSVGSGKTCTAIATASSTFEKQGYTILWVTRTTLKDDIWKNMFDVVCSLNMQEKLSKGVKFPQKQADKMKLLSNSWSIRPMSYKSFTNLVSGKNKIYQDLVKKNGAQDPLRKTLIIIDEAHKLYGGHDLLASEKPDMRKLKASLLKSYQVSGQNSVKLLLMTATPLTSDPMELVKLINLCKDNKDQIPSTFEEFSQVFLDKTGKFTDQGKELYLNMVSGVVSYLNREGDVREFAQPSIQLVNTYMSQLPTGDITGLKEEHNKNVQSIKDILRQLDDSYESFAETKRQQIANEIKDNCGHLKGQDYIDCRNNPSAFVQLLENSIIDMGTKINEIKEEHLLDIQKLNDDFNRIKVVYDNNISQEHVLDKTCKKQESKSGKKSKVVANSNEE